MKTRFAVAALAGLVVAGAATAAGPAPTVLRGAPGIAVAGSAHVVALGRQGVSTTRVSLVRDRDGKVLESRVLRAPLGIPAITFDGNLVEGTFKDGRRVVLASSIYDDASRSTFVVLDTKTLRPLRTVVLRGSFAYDAVSSNGRRLYLLQFPGGVDGGVRYVVRSVDLRTGKLEPGAIVDRTEPSERMSGIALARAGSRDGTWAYTLYNGGTSHAFVHALNTRTRVARCIDLPWAGEAQSVLDGVGMAAARDGVLTLTGRSGAVLARIDTRTFSVQA
jgi:hypothetical protein